MFLLKLAFKNLTRHRKRTLITASIIAAAIVIFLAFDSILLGLNEASYKNIINYSTSEMQVVKNEYWENKDNLPLDNLIEEDQDFINKLSSSSIIEGYSRKLIFQARLNNGIDELPIKAVGVRGDEINKTLDLKSKIIKGEFFLNGEKHAVLGKELADLMNLDYGDYLTLLVRTKEDTFNTIELEIGGLLKTPNPEVNQNNLYLPLNIAQNSLNLNNEFSHLLIKTKNNIEIDRTAAKLENDLKSINQNLKVVPWNDLTAVSVMTAKQGANQMILGIILLLAAIGIINTVILAALERMEEIGMMKAMGMKRSEIIISFVLESTGLAIIGGILGCGLGALVIFFMHNYGIDFAALYDINISEFGIPIIDKIYGQWKIASFFFVFIFSVFVSMISSIFPAYWAANKNPVDAIHHR